MQVLKQENCKMIRDMDLVRDILIKIEQDPMCDRQGAVPLDMPDPSPEELFYHLTLLVEAGFVEANLDIVSLTPTVSGLTWNGCEFIANIKSDTIWAKTKEQARTLPSVGIGVLSKIAESLVMRHFGLS